MILYIVGLAFVGLCASLLLEKKDPGLRRGTIAADDAASAEKTQSR